MPRLIPCVLAGVLAVFACVAFAVARMDAAARTFAAPAPLSGLAGSPANTRGVVWSRRPMLP